MGFAYSSVWSLHMRNSVLAYLMTFFSARIFSTSSLTAPPLRINFVLLLSSILAKECAQKRTEQNPPDFWNNSIRVMEQGIHKRILFVNARKEWRERDEEADPHYLEEEGKHGEHVGLDSLLLLLLRNAVQNRFVHVTRLIPHNLPLLRRWKNNSIRYRL